MKHYALIGAAGYVAPKHMRAIKETKGKLLIAYDPCDSVGILDTYFPECEYYQSYPEFNQRLKELNIDYIVICSPNNTHYGYIYEFLHKEYNVICEKPLTIGAGTMQQIKHLEELTNKKVYTIMQLRLDPTVQALIQYCRTLIAMDKEINMSVRYNTKRGHWYHNSWKGDKVKSGGIVFNIGIHILDIIIQCVGQLKPTTVQTQVGDMICNLTNESANVHLRLSTSGDDPIRNIIINGESFDIGGAFTELHTKSYEMINKGKGYRVDDVEPSIRLAELINDTI